MSPAGPVTLGIGTAADYQRVVRALDPKVTDVLVLAATPGPYCVTLCVYYRWWVRGKANRRAALKLLIDPEDANGAPAGCLAMVPIGTRVFVE